ncbi:unnamed protein product, partial [Adineta steineri]
KFFKAIKERRNTPFIFNKRNGFIRFTLLFILVLIVSILFILEVYYQYGQCAVTAKYSKKNMKLTHRIMDMLDDLSIVYWPDCQSLLNVLRNESYNIWDQDVDLSIEWPFEFNHIHSELNNIQLFIKTFQKNDFNVEYYPDRKL